MPDKLHSPNFLPSEEFKYITNKAGENSKNPIALSLQIVANSLLVQVGSGWFRFTFLNSRSNEFIKYLFKSPKLILDQKITLLSTVMTKNSSAVSFQVCI